MKCPGVLQRTESTIQSNHPSCLLSLQPFSNLYENNYFDMLFTSPKSLTLEAVLLLPALANAQLFTVNCSPLTIQRGDPIVSPGKLSGHVHSVIGGTAFQQTMGETTAVDAKLTTCDKKLDKSNYWVPQLYHITSDSKFEIVEFQGSVSGSRDPILRNILLISLRLYTTSTEPVITRKGKLHAKKMPQSRHHQPTSECLLEIPPFGKFSYCFVFLGLLANGF